MADSYEFLKAHRDRIEAEQRKPVTALCDKLRALAPPPDHPSVLLSARTFRDILAALESLGTWEAREGDAALRTLIAQWREQDAVDARDRGYLEAWNTYQVCANQLEALLSVPGVGGIGSVETKKETNNAR